MGKEFRKLAKGKPAWGVALCLLNAGCSTDYRGCTKARMEEDLQAAHDGTQVLTFNVPEFRAKLQALPKGKRKTAAQAQQAGAVQLAESLLVRFDDMPQHMAFEQLLMKAAGVGSKAALEVLAQALEVATRSVNGRLDVLKGRETAVRATIARMWQVQAYLHALRADVCRRIKEGGE